MNGDLTTAVNLMVIGMITVAIILLRLRRKKLQKQMQRLNLRNLLCLLQW